MKAPSGVLFSLLLVVVQIALPAYSAPPRDLGNAFGKVQRDRQLTIGYFGGSITEGAGASDAAKTSWRSLTTSWFRKQFPNAQITEINAAIGGTGSPLGAFRTQTDLLREYCR